MKGEVQAKTAMNGYWGRLCPYQATLQKYFSSSKKLICVLILPGNKNLSLSRTKNDLQPTCNAYLFNKVKIYINCCAAYDN